MAGIWITGDTHGTIDIKKLSKHNLSRFNFEGTQDENFLIICGDFGLIWNTNGESKEETYWLDWLESKPFTTLFVSGNHENFDRLYSDEYKIINWHGGKAQQIRPHVIHLLRGEIYSILGKSIFTFGGASSHDIKDGILDAVKDKQKIKEWSNPNNPEYYTKQFRINHKSWWSQEIASKEEQTYALENLKNHNNEVDFIVSHCAPQEIASMMGCTEPDDMTRFFNIVANTIKFKSWYFGHYHIDTQIFGKFYCLYNYVMQID